MPADSERGDNSPKVILVCMPFQSITSPAIGISLLKAELRSRGIDCHVEYLNLRFANLIEPDVYEAIADQHFVGELMFSQQLLGTNRHDLRSVIVPRSSPGVTNCVIDLDDMRKVTSRFLNDCLYSMNWPAYQIIGFTLGYQQTAPALCLARLVKQKWPNLCMVFGGTSCEEEMGAEIHRQYSFIDYVFSGEADETFPEFVWRRSKDSDCQLDGIVSRDKTGKTVLPRKWTAPVMELDSLPYPDYDDYFDQLSRFRFRGYTIEVGLPLETSRGCWWGEKSRCTFCAFNGLTIAYRSKSPNRVLDEIKFLSENYAKRFSTFEVVDSILDLRYFTNVLSRLAECISVKPIFSYTKANLTKAQVRLLARAGVWGIQPGIESLSTKILRLMSKGCSMLQNIQLLKWCREYGIEVAWNLIYGIPNEDPIEYQRIPSVIHRITHLQPPSHVCKVMLQRFSRFFAEPRKFGMVNIRPSSWYSETYGLSNQSLSKMAYCFEFDYEDKRDPDEYVRLLKEEVENWKQTFARSRFHARRSSEGLLVTTDTRAYVDSCQGDLFQSPLADIIEYCDQTRHFSAIAAHLRNRTPNCEAKELKRYLDNLVESGIVLEDEENYLSLPILQ